MAQEQDDNLTELCNHVHGDENPAVAQSAFGSHRYRSIGIQVSGNCLFICLICRYVALFRMWVGASFLI